MITFSIALLMQGPAASDAQFQHEMAARTVYAACLFRENDRRRALGRSSLDDFGSSCTAERNEIIRLDRQAGRRADVIEAGLQGTEDTLRQSIARMNEFYPAEK